MADLFPTALQRTSDESWVTLEVVAREPGRLVARLLEDPAHAAVIRWGGDAAYDQHVRQLLASPPPVAGQGVHLAWPDDLLHDLDARIVGYLTPRVRRNLTFALADYVDPVRRWDIAPLATRRHHLRVARNTATAIAAIHHAGHGRIRARQFRLDDRAQVLLVRADEIRPDAPRLVRTDDEQRLTALIGRLIGGSPWIAGTDIGPLLARTPASGRGPAPASEWFHVLHEAERSIPPDRLAVTPRLGDKRMATPSELATALAVARAERQVSPRRQVAHGSPIVIRVPDRDADPAGGRPSMDSPIALPVVALPSVAGSSVAGSRVAGSRVAGSRVAGSRVAGSRVAGSRVAGSRVAGSRVAGSRVAGSSVGVSARAESVGTVSAGDFRLAPGSVMQRIGRHAVDDPLAAMGADPAAETAEAGSPVTGSVDGSALEQDLGVDQRRSSLAATMDAFWRRGRAGFARPSNGTTPTRSASRRAFVFAAGLALGALASIAPFAAFLAGATTVFTRAAVRTGPRKATLGPSQTTAGALTRFVPFAAGGMALAAFVLFDLLLVLGLVMGLAARLFDYGPGFTLNFLYDLPEVPLLVRWFAFAVGGATGLGLGGGLYDTLRQRAGTRRMIATPAFAIAVVFGLLVMDAGILWWPFPATG